MAEYPAARLVTPMAADGTAMNSLQNGVSEDEVLRRVLGKHAVMGGVCYIAAPIAEPGVIRHSGVMQRMVFGEHDGVVSERATAFLAACRNSGIDAEISPDIRAIWEKFVFLVGLSGTNSAVRLPIGAIRSHPQTRGRLLDAMWEVVAVGRAGGVNVTGVPTPINRVLHDVLARFGGSQQSTANTLASVFFGNPQIGHVAATTPRVPGDAPDNCSRIILLNGAE